MPSRAPLLLGGSLEQLVDEALPILAEVRLFATLCLVCDGMAEVDAMHMPGDRVIPN